MGSAIVKRCDELRADLLVVGRRNIGTVKRCAHTPHVRKLQPMVLLTRVSCGVCIMCGVVWGEQDGDGLRERILRGPCDGARADRG